MTRVDQKTEVSRQKALFRTAINLAADVMRRRQLRSAYETDSISAGDQSGRLRKRHWKRSSNAVAQVAVETLPTKCRTMFLLHKRNICPMARRHGSTFPSAVEKHMTKALAHCRDYLERDGR